MDSSTDLSSTDDYQTELFRLKNQIKQLETTGEFYAQECEKLDSLLSEETAKVASLNTQVTELTREVKNVYDVLAEKDHEIAELAERGVPKSEVKVVTEKQVEYLQDPEIIEELKKYRAENKHLEMELNAMKDSFGLMQFKIKEYEEDIGLYRAKEKDFHAQRIKMSEELIEAQQTNATLRDKLNESKPKDMAKQGNSIYAELDDARKKADKALLEIARERDTLKAEVRMMKNQMESMRNVSDFSEDSIDIDFVKYLSSREFLERSECDRYKRQYEGLFNAQKQNKEVEYLRERVKEKDSEFARLYSQIGDIKERERKFDETRDVIQTQLKELLAENVVLKSRISGLESRAQQNSDTGAKSGKENQPLRVTRKLGIMKLQPKN